MNGPIRWVEVKPGTYRGVGQDGMTVAFATRRVASGWRLAHASGRPDSFHRTLREAKAAAA